MAHARASDVVKSNQVSSKKNICLMPVPVKHILAVTLALLAVVLLGINLELLPNAEDSIAVLGVSPVVQGSRVPEECPAFCTGQHHVEEDAVKTSFPK